MPPSTATLSDHDAARAHFPACASPTAFLDNAGGSQLPAVVIDAMTAYLRESYVQLGADYEVSRRATATVAAAHRYLKFFMGAIDPGGRDTGQVIIGPSTSQLIATLATAYAPRLAPGDEIIISDASHESNAGPWRRLAPSFQEHGRAIIIKPWPINPITFAHDLAELGPLLSPRTRLVCFPHVSNILGRVEPLADIIPFIRARAPHARILVDGVALAPHRAIHAHAWDADFYVYSTYKVFGPHAAALYAKHDALAPLTGPNHDFIPSSELPRKFELGGVSHEAAAGILALDHFLRDLAGTPRLPDLIDPHARYDRAIIDRAFDTIEHLETPLMARLLDYLSSVPGLRLIGPTATDRSRVSIISFTKPGTPSASIARAGNALHLGFRFGNFYAFRLCRSLGLDPADGVVRVSFCHYNTPAEVERLIAFLRQTL